MTTDYGSRLRAARKFAGMNQVDLSKATGIAQSTISTAERLGHGSADTPVYAKALGVDAHWLATGKGSMHPNTIDVQAVDITHRTSMPEPATITLAQALEVLGDALAPLDATARRRAGTLLADLADDPASHASLADILAMVIESGKRRAA